MKQSTHTPAEWRDVEAEQAYKLNQAEWRGSIVQAVKDIDERLERMERNNDIRGFVTYGVSALIAGIVSILTGQFNK